MYQLTHKHSYIGITDEELIFESESEGEAQEIKRYYLEYLNDPVANVYIEHIEPKFKTYEEARIFFKR